MFQDKKLMDQTTRLIRKLDQHDRVDKSSNYKSAQNMDIVGIINPIPIYAKTPKSKFLKRDSTQKVFRPLNAFKRSSLNSSMETIVEERHVKNAS